MVRENTSPMMMVARMTVSPASANYQGIVMTDDLVMGAIYQNNVCTAVVEALNAGVDLLLVAFDGAQFYRIFACAKDASSRGRLDPAMLRDSEVRLKRAFPVD
jgi:beta-N-acetylhexosaminidase